MRTNDFRKKRCLKAMFAFFWITFGLLILPILVSATNYPVSLQKGTIRQKVDFYNKDIWNNTVSSISGPENFLNFGGEANITGAESKYVVRAWYEETWNTSDVFGNLFMVNISSPLHNATEINQNYTTTYELNLILISKWSFNSSVLPENATLPNSFLYIVKDPTGFKQMLSDYNTYASKSSDPFLFNISTEDFIYRLFKTQFGVGAPIDGYLSEMVDELNNENVTSEVNTLSLKLRGEGNYSVQISFDSMGLQSSISFLDSDNNIFYKIITYDTEWTVWLTIGIFGTGIIAVVIYAFYRRRQRIKQFEESLERMKS
ncbi:MAG: hypothetical protein GF311_11485 [Candidatus Lokiarchaeota archaeon]|nr:hypothetical protein [Candidatus Lokiarchaeota archaeon]